MKKSTLGGSMPRDIGSVVLRGVGFGITGWYSDFREHGIFPEGYIGNFRSGTRGDFVGEGVGYEILK